MAERATGANLVLIGMPGVGKSTLGVLLAKRLGLGFVDTDLMIQQQLGTTLQSYLESHGYEALRQAEEKTIHGLVVQRAVIATGGSAVYSQQAMQHLASGGAIVYLQIVLAKLLARDLRLAERGIAAPAGTTLQQLFDERSQLYEQWSDLVVDCNTGSADAIVDQIADWWCCSEDT